MKNITISLFLFLLFGASHTKAQYAPLKIGEAVPDFEFAIQNYHSPTAKFSDFKGKLIFLDFWSTNCSSCINNFPKIEAWQKQYGDKMQVILVNIRETEEEVETQLKSRKKEIPTLKQMPSIINNKVFAQLFPHEYAGNYVWIDKNGILRLSTGLHYNIYKAKIDDVIAGKPITFLKNGKIYYKDEPSLSEIIYQTPIKHPEIGSLFTAVDLNYFPSGGQHKRLVDSTSNTIRNTYVNRSIIALYFFALEGLLKDEWKSKVYGPNLGKSYLDIFKVIVKDSSYYDYRLIPKTEQTDMNITRSLFSYEQILPQNTSDTKALTYMREDLDRFFGFKYGTTVCIEEVILPSYIIKKASNLPLSEREIKRKMRHLGKRNFETHSYIDGIIGEYFHVLDLKLPYVFDIEELNGKLEVIMPKWKKRDSLEEFQNALRINGLEFIKVNRKMKMIVVRDSQ